MTHTTVQRYSAASIVQTSFMASKYSQASIDSRKLGSAYISKSVARQIPKDVEEAQKKSQEKVVKMLGGSMLLLKQGIVTRSQSAPAYMPKSLAKGFQASSSKEPLKPSDENYPEDCKISDIDIAVIYKRCKETDAESVITTNLSLNRKSKFMSLGDIKKHAAEMQNYLQNSKTVKVALIVLAVQITAVAATKIFGPTLMLQSGKFIVTTGVKLAAPVVTHLVFPIIVNTITAVLPWVLVAAAVCYAVYRAVRPIVQPILNGAQELITLLKGVQQGANKMGEVAVLTTEKAAATAQAFSYGAAAATSAITNPIRKDPMGFVINLFSLMTA